MSTEIDGAPNGLHTSSRLIFVNARPLSDSFALSVTLCHLDAFFSSDASRVEVEAVGAKLGSCLSS
jgi:hypothetical protein